MKILSIVLTLLISSLISSLAMASGFVCEGQGYNVKMYNEVQPTLGTQNPGILVVATAQGTLARLQGVEIEKFNTPESVIYTGHNNAVDTGRFIKVSLEVSKQPIAMTGALAATHPARLLINADNGTWTANLACQAYLKGQN